MTIQLAYKQLLAALFSFYSDREAKKIADMVIEHVTGLPKIERIMNREMILSQAQEEEISRLTSELMQQRPVQYVLNESWFGNIKLYVDERVLIPRPETEELVEWIVKDITGMRTGQADKLCMLDVGTGSGCIAISLKKKQPAMFVTAIDVSAGALEVARQNAAENKALIDFVELDFLNADQRSRLAMFDIIASNPPYIKRSEAEDMEGHVTRFEPSAALFVPDNDALIFYEAIAKFALQHLLARGHVYVEINEALGNEVVDLFTAAGLKDVVLKKDMQGKDRMVRAAKA